MLSCCAFAIALISGAALAGSPVAADGVDPAAEAAFAENPVNPGTASPNPGVVPRRLRQFEGQVFYAIEPGFRCTGPGPGASAIASWRGKIEFRDGQMIDWGDRCNNEGLPVQAKDVSVGFWGRSLRYRGLVYRPSRNIEQKLRLVP